MAIFKFQTGGFRLPVFFLVCSVLMQALPPAGRSQSPRVSEAQVELALLDYARTRDPQDLARAETLARQTAPEGAEARAVVSPEALLRVAQAGGHTLSRADTLLKRLQTLDQVRGTTDANAQLVSCLFLYAQATRSPTAMQKAEDRARAFLNERLVREGGRLRLLPGGSRASESSLLDYVETLRALVQIGACAPELVDVSLVRALGQRLLARFWDEDTQSLRPHAVDTAMMGPLAAPFLNARAVPVLWMAGCMTGEPLLMHRAQRLGSTLTATDPMIQAEVDLARAVLALPPVGVVVVGDPRNPEVRRMGQDAYYAFDPRKVIVYVDPDRDGERLAELGLKPESGLYVGLLVPEGAYRLIPDPSPETVEAACIQARRR